MLCSFLLTSGVASGSSRASVSVQRRPGSISTPQNPPPEKRDSGPAIDVLQREVASLVQAGKLTEAEALAREAVKSWPRDANRRALHGAVLDQLGQAEAAEGEYREALRIDSRSVIALTNLGVLLARTNRTPEALQTFERVLTIEPNHGQAIYNLAALYLSRKEYPRAIQLLEKAAGGPPESSDDLGLLLKLADAYAHGGRAADAGRLSFVIESEIW